VAANCCVVPLPIDGLEGVTEIETNTAGPTVREVLPVTPAALALIWEVPWAAPVARPPAVMVATAAFDETQVAELVRSWVLPSEYVPVAVNCSEFPLAIDGLAGLTAIDTNTGEPTVTAALPETPIQPALICDVPCASPVASPLALTVATAAFEETQVAELVRSWLLPSEYVPVAASCCVVPWAIDGLVGLTEIDTNTAGPTVRVVLPVTPAEAALIWEVPCAAPVARPVAVIVATAVLDESHVAVLVTSTVVPSE
jgi:hypothetical protein